MKVFEEYSQKCSFCNIVFPFLLIKDIDGNLYCSKKCFTASGDDYDENHDPVTNCCGAPFWYPGYPDSDICSRCLEHAGVEEEEDNNE